MIHRGVGGVVLAFACGCSVEVAPAQEERAASQVTSAIVSNGQEWGSADSPWQPGPWHAWFKELPYAYVGLPSGSSSLIAGNDHEFPILVQGVVYFTCEENQPWPYSIYLGNAPAAVVTVAPHSLLPIPLYCVPASSLASVFYRPIAPDGAVPFRGAYAQAGDSTNFFPTQMRIQSAIPIARSEPLNLEGDAHRTLLIRYSHSHPGSPSALVNVGIQNLDANGDTAQAFNSVAFPVTRTSPSFDQWGVVKVRLSTPSAVQHVYVRLQIMNGEILYLDSAWVR